MHAGVYGSGGGRGRVGVVGRDHAELGQQPVEVGALELPDPLVQGELLEGFMSMSVTGLPSLMSVVAFSRSRMSNVLPHTSGTPRSTLHSV